MQKAIARGVSVYQGDLESALEDYPDQAFDYVILSQTLQETRNPLKVLREHAAHRQARASWRSPISGTGRVRLGASVDAAALRKTELFPYDWYDSPNIHFLTVLDFESLAHKQHWKIERRMFLAGGRAGDDVPESDGRSRGVPVSRRRA